MREQISNKVLVEVKNATDRVAEKFDITRGQSIEIASTLMLLDADELDENEINSVILSLIAKSTCEPRKKF